MSQEPESEARSESQVLEWKSSLAERRAGLESLCGMINAEPACGRIEFGIGPQGQVKGIEPGDLDKTQRSLAQEIGLSFQPNIQVTIRVEQREGRLILVVEGRRNRDVPYHEYDGRAGSGREPRLGSSAWPRNSLCNDNGTGTCTADPGNATDAGPGQESSRRSS
jgi:predicted HTH transcriptional regulator